MNNSDLFFFFFFLREHSQACGKSHEFMTQLCPPRSLRKQLYLKPSSILVLDPRGHGI